MAVFELHTTKGPFKYDDPSFIHIQTHGVLIAPGADRDHLLVFWRWPQIHSWVLDRRLLPVLIDDTSHEWDQLLAAISDDKEHELGRLVDRQAALKG